MTYWQLKIDENTLVYEQISQTNVEQLTRGEALLIHYSDFQIWHTKKNLFRRGKNLRCYTILVIIYGLRSIIFLAIWVIFVCKSLFEFKDIFIDFLAVKNLIFLLLILILFWRITLIFIIIENFVYILHSRIYTYACKFLDIIE